MPLAGLYEAGEKLINELQSMMPMPQQHLAGFGLSGNNEMFI